MTPPVFGRTFFEIRGVDGELIGTSAERWQAEARARNRKERTGLDADVFESKRVSSTRGEYVIAAPGSRST